MSGDRTIDTTRLAAARLRAADVYPFLALALYALTPIADPGRGTFAVDEQWRLYVDPEALDRWSVEEVAGVLLHEVGHVVRDHAARARNVGVGEETAARWNLAADAEINDDLIADEVRLPATPVTPDTLGMPPGRVAEYYYHQLASTPPADSPHDCGSGCHGVSDDHAEAVRPVGPLGLSAAEAMLLRRRIAITVMQQGGKQPGNVAGGWTRWAEALLRPAIDWRRVLRGKIRRALAAVSGNVDYTYRRPPRRRSPGVILPSLHRPLPRVAVVVDTSGSVSDTQLARAWTEVQGCLRSIGVRRDLLTVYSTDTDAKRITDLRRRTALTGGGGTDVGVGIRAALNARPRPDLIVVITDGYTPWPPRAPRRTVIVALLPSQGPVPVPPPWARVVHINAAELTDESA